MGYSPRLAHAVALLALASFLGCSSRDSFAQAPHPDRPLTPILVNDNRASAGELQNGILHVSLVAEVGLWYPEVEHGPGLEIQAFGEEGKPLQAPGPLIRVPAGTEVRVRLRNALGVPLLVR